ncbi:two-component system sensor histidine kinase NtrB [Spirochaeta isovalerica]|uniref:histidine kinase n=1 Tax=Spirochaeta isovalerica TaxID=150 RepID=A0A841R8P9_9SPIO|nr:PAS domain-containing sensor histidine kinase [Spirochaeta isovalerica]MBB6480176.1 PAS domain S-box-containing protein [Spirochaeta isovalerica]
MNEKELLEELNIHQIELEQQNLELLASQQELEKSNARYRDLFNTAPVGYLICDSQGTIHDINQTAARMFGLPYSDIINKNITLLIWPDDQDEYYLLNQSSSTGDSSTIQSLSLRMKKADETYFHAHLNFFSEPSGDRRIAVSDISPLKQAEEALITSQRMAAVIDFAGNASHDLSNSLQGIMNYIELASLKARNESPSHRGSNYYEAIQTIVEKMTERIRELQNLSRGFHGESEKSELDLSAMLSSLWESYGRTISPHIEKIGKIEDNLLVSGHEEDLKQVVLLLLKNGENSIKGAGSLTLKAYREDQWIVVAVKNTGEGMDKETARRIFEPFFSTGGYKTGLNYGLTGVYSIIEEHGGKIKVIYTEKGKGTVIEIRLPYLN